MTFGVFQGIRAATFFLVVCLEVLPAQGATYYISPTGSDTNPGTLTKPWLTFAYTLDPARASCGDTLVLMNGTYGDSTNTGKLDVAGLICTQGNELTITAQNQRKAKIVDDGSGKAVWIRSSAYIILNGIYARSTDNSAFGPTTSEKGVPIQVRSSNHITVRNGVFRNPNRYPNTAATGAYFSSQVLFEDNEVYVFHRHCFTAWQSSEIVVRRQYCNPRGGKIPGGYGLDQGPLGSGASVMSMYPCRDCILENSIGEGAMYLNEMNATFGNNILMSGSKVLGSILYNSTYGNGIYPNPRSLADLNHTPQNIMIKDVAIINFNSAGFGIRCSDCVNATVEHVTITGGGKGVTGIFFDDTANGSTPATNSFTVKDSTVSGMTGTGYIVESGAYATWLGNNLRSYGNRTAFIQVPQSNWGTTYSNSPEFGSCKGLWVPDGSPGKAKGTGGSDIGATILYRYVNGVLTSIPLWDVVTGEFPYGEADADGTNRVAGDSLFDIHTRLNVNTGGCSFPKGYGNGNSDTKEPTSPIGLSVS